MSTFTHEFISGIAYFTSRQMFEIVFYAIEY